MLSIVSLFALIVSACAGGLTHLGAPTLLSNGVLGSTVVQSAPLWSGALHRSVLGAPSVLAHQHVTVARPATVAVERVSYGSVPSVSVVNEPTSIVAPGKPIRGHSFTSEVRHDSVARFAAPLITSYAAPALAHEVLEAPALSARVVEGPSYAAYPSTVVSAPQVYATGPASVIAGPASVKGYTLETGRTDLVNEVRLRAASIPATVVHDTVVESAPVYSSIVRQPHVLSHADLLGAPLLPTLWKK